MEDFYRIFECQLRGQAVDLSPNSVLCRRSSETPGLSPSESSGFGSEACGNPCPALLSTVRRACFMRHCASVQNGLNCTCPCRYGLPSFLGRASSPANVVFRLTQGRPSVAPGLSNCPGAPPRSPHPGGVIQSRSPGSSNTRPRVRVEQNRRRAGSPRQSSLTSIPNVLLNIGLRRGGQLNDFRVEQVYGEKQFMETGGEGGIGVPLRCTAPLARSRSRCARLEPSNEARLLIPPA